jgi:iron complex transport system ATP-binding protein
MDEPTSALDFKNQYKTLKMIKEVADEHGICILFTTHQPEHALYVSGKTLLMGGEDFNFFGETTEVISEENLKKIYGLNTKIVEINHELGISKAVVPIME